MAKDPLFGAAVLKVTLERRPGGLSPVDELYRGVLADLGVTDAQVDAYLAAHRAEVVAAVDRKARDLKAPGGRAT